MHLPLFNSLTYKLVLSPLKIGAILGDSRVVLWLMNHAVILLCGELRQVALTCFTPAIVIRPTLSRDCDTVAIPALLGPQNICKVGASFWQLDAALVEIDEWVHAREAA